MNMLNNKFIVFVSLLILELCSCSQRICGIYQEEKELAIYQLELRCDSTFTLTLNTLPTSLCLKGNWGLKDDTLLLKVKEDIRIEKKVESDTLSNLNTLPVRQNHWELNLQDFGVFKIKDKRIETTYKGIKIIFSKKGFSKEKK